MFGYLCRIDELICLGTCMLFVGARMFVCVFGFVGIEGGLLELPAINEGPVEEGRTLAWGVMVRGLRF